MNIKNIISDRYSENKKKLFQNTAFLYLMRFAIYACPLLTTPYLTRVLHENNYGIYTWTNAIINYARLVVDFGFVLYGVEAIASCKTNKKGCGEIVGTVIKYKMILSFITGIVLGILCIVREDFREYALMIFLSYLSVVVSIFNIDYLFQGLEQMRYITIRVLITKALFTVMVFLFIRSPEMYILVPLFTALGDAISVVLMLRNMHQIGITIVWKKLASGVTIFKKSLWFFYSRVFGAIYSYGNTIIIGVLFSKADAAQYGIAYTLLVLLQNFISPISDSLYPYMVKNRDFKLLKRLLCIFEPIIIICCIVGYFISPWIIPLVFGEEYNLSPYIFRGMLLMVVIALPEYLVGYPALSALGKFKEPNIAVIVAGCFHGLGLLFLYLMNSISIMNIVLLTFFSELIVTVLRGVFLHKAYLEIRRS